MFFNRFMQNRKSSRVFIPVLMLAVLTLPPLCHAASAKKTPVKPEAIAFPSAPVIFDNKTLFLIQAKVLSFSPEERAKLIAERIKRLADNPLVLIGTIRAIEGEMASDIVAGDIVIMSVTDEDARAAGRKRPELAREYALILHNAIGAERQAYSMRSILFGAAFSFLLTVLFVVGYIFLKRLLVKIYALIESRKDVHIPAVKFQKLEIISSERLANVIKNIARLIYSIVIIFGLYLYMASVLRLFPWTRNWSSQIVGYVMKPVIMIGDAFVSYLPDFFVFSVIVVITYYGLKLIKFIFTAIGKETISFPGFFPEWAEPTYAIVRFLVISFAAVVAFPYMPGSNSPAFKGVSIFIGVLFSLGSTSAVANVVAGIIITYMRAFKIGDRVKISDATGDVLEKTLLITRLRTIKNEDITIPNAMVLGSHIINYSSSLPPDAALILHTGVTIGYDAPWRTVHALLLAAAAKTAHILADPPPFIFQTSLDDFYVSYELNAYTDAPAKMASTYSVLHQNIQDRFNEGGVEIMSPHYSSLREGNQTTIPENYLSKTYTPPAFRVSRTGGRPDEKV